MMLDVGLFPLGMRFNKPEEVAIAHRRPVDVKGGKKPMPSGTIKSCPRNRYRFVASNP